MDFVSHMVGRVVERLTRQGNKVRQSVIDHPIVYSSILRGKSQVDGDLHPHKTGRTRWDDSIGDNYFRVRLPHTMANLNGT